MTQAATSPSDGALPAEPGPGSYRPHQPVAGRGAADAEGPEHEDLTPESALARTIEEGRRRMERGWVAMAATGVVGGLDVGTGVLAMLLVEHATGSKLLGGLAFGIGFIALTLASSELFTEDFLVPVSTVVARKARLRDLFRLWGVTLVSNLVGGWVFTGLIMLGLPELRSTAVELGSFYYGLHLGSRAFALAILGGGVITLMTWMQHSTESVGAKLAAAVTTAFLLGAASLNHAIVVSLQMFAALHAGAAPFGYPDWLATASWATLGNILGGVGLVTTLRLLQVPHRVELERRNAT